MPDFKFYHAPSPVEGSPHVMIATPANNLHGNYVASIARALPLVMGSGIAIDHFLLMGCVHVDDARNICVRAFLDTNCEALVFIDADVGFPPEALARLSVLMGDVVAGVYPRKEYPPSWPFKTEPGVTLQAGEDGGGRNGILGLPTGFMKISRRVLEGMAGKAYLDGNCFDPVGVGAGKVPVIFERGLMGGERASGDIAFCFKAREVGFEIAMDPTLPFTHAGEVNFGGRLLDHLTAPPAEESNTDGERVPEEPLSAE